MRWRLLCLLVLFGQSGCEKQQQLTTSLNSAAAEQAQTPGHQLQLQQQLYIWQRVWTDEHQIALAQSQTQFSALRVLALQYFASAKGPLWHQADVSLELLKKDGRPIFLVLRLDGQIPKLPHNQLLKKLQPILALYQQAGIHIAGIEIDYDCARSQLAAYRQWLSELNKTLPGNLTLGITALPDWLQSAEFTPLSAQVSQLTMQLHAVLSPEQGLFQPELAKQWAKAAAAQSKSPLYFALPAYHSALITQTNNTTASQSAKAEPKQYWVESEAPLDIAGERQELWVDPLMMQQWLQWLKRQSFQNVKGIVWFRLPLTSDRRSWAYRTLAAVATNQPLKADIRLSLQTRPQGFDLVAQNNGNIPGLIATSIQLKGVNCRGADALAGLQLTQQQQQYQLNSTTKALPLPVAKQQTLAWFNCQSLQLLPET